MYVATFFSSAGYRNEEKYQKDAFVNYYYVNMYASCAQKAEIDECQDYPKALGALEQAIKVLSKVKGGNVGAVEAKILFFEERLEIIKRFVEARRLFYYCVFTMKMLTLIMLDFCSVYQSDPQKSVHICQELLDEHNLDVAIRVGDVYGLMIEYDVEVGNHEHVRYR